MSRPPALPDLYLLSKVSTLYYERDQTQQEIAERLRISRPMVSRLLSEARRRGIVQISILPPPGARVELESALEEKYGLENVQVVPVDPATNPEGRRRQIGASAAAYLARTLQPKDTLGMSWGSTLSAMVRALAPLASSGVRVVQMLGGVGPPDSDSYGSALVRRTAQLLHASPVLLPAPGIVATSAVRDSLRKDAHVRTALRELDSLTTAFVGLGALATNAVLNDGHSLSRGTRSELLAAGAVGDISMRFFDENGAPVKTSLDDRVLGITTAQLRKVPRVVAIAGGLDKVDAIAAALHAGIVNVLITDQSAAEALARREN
jgi:DNA-binding transcriptional regulator LsrR (DeoR family)